MSDAASGALSGAAQGAAAGASIGGGFGAAIGGVIGGVAGLFGGRKSDKAAKYKKELKKLSRYVARKELLQQSRMQQAEASNAIASGGAGTERSSGGFGVLSSVASQRGVAIHMQDFANKRTDKIQKLEFQANQIAGLVSGASSLVNNVGDAYRQFQGPPKETPSGPNTNPNGTIDLNGK